MHWVAPDLIPRSYDTTRKSISQEAIYHGILYKDFLNIPGLREAASQWSYWNVTPKSQYIKVIRLLQHSSPIVNGGDSGCIVHDLKTIIVLALLTFYIIPQSLTAKALTNPAEIADQGLSCCNSNARGWHNSHQSGVISITN